jgi:hypothetical protein
LESPVVSDATAAAAARERWSFGMPNLCWGRHSTWTDHSPTSLPPYPSLSPRLPYSKYLSLTSATFTRIIADFNPFSIAALACIGRNLPCLQVCACYASLLRAPHLNRRHWPSSLLLFCSSEFVSWKSMKYMPLFPFPLKYLLEFEHEFKQKLVHIVW